MPEIYGFPDTDLVGLWLPTEEGLTLGANVSTLADLSGNGNNVSLHLGAQVPVATATSLQTTVAGAGFMFDTDIPWGQEFSIVLATRFSHAVASGTYPVIHQSTSGFQSGGMGVSNPETGVTINVDHGAAAANIQPAMFANAGGGVNFGGSPRKGVTIDAASHNAWFITAWSYKPSTDQFTFRAKASGAILGTSSTDGPTAAYMEAFGGLHAFGLGRYLTNNVSGEFHGTAMYSTAKDADGLDALITSMKNHMNAVGIDTV
ncbi:hypothetical protein [Novosphingobium clariflavum]|uniref:Transferrin-binding protein B C-lobe/N-lobe beta barrel domain-containing protein n=1 Tax=Novosphingobium clariflavum TaxID=2029884 RepID=A0ABV6S7A0_9SPHN|nr:hypothetical protein [Novosphingobium clariflavum]